MVDLSAKVQEVEATREDAIKKQVEEKENVLQLAKEKADLREEKKLIDAELDLSLVISNKNYVKGNHC